MTSNRFRLYLDETGTEDLSCAHEPSNRHLGLTGIIMPDAAIEDATTRLRMIKKKFFPSHPDEPEVVFHRADMVHGRGPFKPLRCAETRELFNAWWIRYLSVTQYTTITVVIDKLAMARKTHWLQNHPYHYAMEVIVEKYTQFLLRENATGDLMPEKRMGKKDSSLQDAYSEIRDKGTKYVSRDLITRMIPANELKFREKKQNITGLQIADCIAKPSCATVRHLRDKSVPLSDFDKIISEILIRTKYDRPKGDHGRIWGYGIKFLP